MTAAPSGRSTASADRTARSPLATPIPARMPRPRRHDSGDQGLDQDRTADLAAARADRPQHRHLLGPLGDRDGEGVVDDEGSDEDRDPGEDQQEDLERSELLGEGCLVLGDELLTGDDLDGGRQGLLQGGRPAPPGWSQDGPSPRPHRSARGGQQLFRRLLREEDGAAPAAESAAPNEAMPEIVKARGSPLVSTVARSPTWKPAARALPRSITISSAARGPAPSTIR